MIKCCHELHGCCATRLLYTAEEFAFLQCKLIAHDSLLECLLEVYASVGNLLPQQNPFRVCLHSIVAPYQQIRPPTGSGIKKEASVPKEERRWWVSCAGALQRRQPEARHRQGFLPHAPPATALESHHYNLEACVHGHGVHAQQERPSRRPQPLQDPPPGAPFTAFSYVLSKLYNLEICYAC
jgi:hypothetical protein